MSAKTKRPAIRLLSGYHMTAARRRGFLVLIDAGLDVGRIGRTEYQVNRRPDGVYEGKVVYRAASGGGWGPVAWQTDRYTFTIDEAAS